MSNTNEHIHFPAPVTEDQREEAARLMAAIGVAQKALNSFDAPAMGTRLEMDLGGTVDSDAPLVLVCPWCRTDVYARDLHDRELAERWTYASDIDGSERSVRFSYSGHGEYDSVTLVHEPCGLPVALPENWIQETT